MAQQLVAEGRDRSGPHVNPKKEVHVNDTDKLKSIVDFYQMRKLLNDTVVFLLHNCRSESVIQSSLFAFALINPLHVLALIYPLLILLPPTISNFSIDVSF